MRFKVFGGDNPLHGSLQYFTGYGESQLTYIQRSHALRIGVSI